MKQVLFVNHQPPHGSHLAKEQLQMAMVFGAYEQHVSMLFMNDGVMSLLAGQNTAAIGFDDFSKIYGALAKYYGISDIYVDEQALTDRELGVDRLVIPVQPLSQRQIDLLLRQQDFIISV